MLRHETWTTSYANDSEGYRETDTSVKSNCNVCNTGSKK
jgi:hypothetical protein